MVFEEFTSYLKHFNEINGFEQLQDEDINSLSKLFCYSNQFLYFLDLRSKKPSFIYLSSKIERVLGYKADNLTPELLYSLIHPDDRLLVNKATIRMVEIQKKLNLEPRKYYGHMTFRMKHADGRYIHVARQTTNFKNDTSETVSISISLYTNIEHLNHNNKVELFWSGPNNEQIDFNDSTNFDVYNNGS